jgi:prepilin-type N-terminal cleavage/methylation domain-containing protein
MVTVVPRRTKLAGFTLVEVMITVTIVAILAAIAIPTFSSYIRQSRMSEATGFLSEIKARQESYRSDFGMYCDVSGTQANWYPTGQPTASARAWAPNAQWNTLGAAPPGRMALFSYSTVAGAPGTQPNFGGSNATRGYGTDDFWFISSAFGDLDGDGATMTMESYSHSKTMWTDFPNGE